MGVWMKSASVSLLLGAMTVALAGCGSTMRDYLEKETPAQTTSVRQDLTMPPDLRLPPPGTTAPAPDTAALAGSSSAALTAPPPATAAPKAPAAGAAAFASNSPDAVYVNAGISVTNPDGTRKSDAQLRKELQEYYIAQKKAKNPNYGTVFNIGNIFKDE